MCVGLQSKNYYCNYCIKIFHFTKLLFMQLHLEQFMYFFLICNCLLKNYCVKYKCQIYDKYNLLSSFSRCLNFIGKVKKKFVFLSCMYCTACCLLIISWAVTEEVSPKFVKGTKRYGRRSRPDKSISVLTDETEKDETPSTGVRRAKLRRSTSLESVEVRSFTLSLSVWFQECCTQPFQALHKYL